MDYKVHNKTDMPDNIIEQQNKVIDKSIEIQNDLPFFMRDFFIYLKIIPKLPLCPGHI